MGLIFFYNSVDKLILYLYEILVVFTLQEYKFSSFGVYKHEWGAMCDN